VLVIGSLMLKPDDRRARANLDLGGVALVSLSMLLLFVPLTEGRDAGWPVWMIAALVVCVLAAAGFVLWERNITARGATPLFDVALSRQRASAVGLGITLAFFIGNAGFSFLFALFL
jgi:hypothetical protein